MIAGLLARLGALAAGAWAKLVFAGAIALALFGVYAAIRKGGRDAERADQLQAGMGTIAAANKAAKSVDPSAEAIANDPDNLDRR